MNIDISQLDFIHPKLRELLTWLERKTGFEFTITSLYRIGDSGVHGTLPLRGIDLRCRRASIGVNTVVLINSYWFYDIDRPEMFCCILHGEGRNLHLHIQVHDNTEYVGD